jgi:drug/metabolite transporter (DMT)-like permease
LPRVSVLLGLLSAAAFGSADFIGGIASRRAAPGIAATAVHAVAAIVAVVAVLLYPGAGFSGHALLWGGAVGVGSAVGVLALYRGLAVGRMSVVATLSGLLAAVIPVIFGLATGDTLSALGVLGVIAAIPAIVLVSWQPGERSGGGGTGAIWGIVSGFGVALFLIGYDRAGTADGAWPFLIAEVTATVLTLPAALLALRHGGSVRVRGSGLILLGGGVLVGLANLSFIVSNHLSELAVAAVLVSLYPGFTVILARVFLHERWSTAQKFGLATALVAALLVGLAGA